MADISKATTAVKGKAAKAADALGDAISAAPEAAKISVATVKEQATTIVSEASETARRAATQGKDMAAQALDELGKFADSAAKAVDERIGAQYGDYARKAATTVSNAATALQDTNIDDIVADTKAFVKKRPAVAIGAVAALGLVLTQVVRGASRRGNGNQD